MIHGQPFLGKFAKQIGDDLALQMQIRLDRAARLVLRLVGFFLRLGIVKIGILVLELLHVVKVVKIMNRFVIAFADFDDENRERAFLAALLDVITEIAALTTDERRVFVERFEQRQNFFELLRRKFTTVRKIFQLHFFRAVLQQDAVELNVVINVIGLPFARDAVKRRLRDVNVAILDELRHLAIKKREQQRADVRAVHVGG